MYLYFLCAPNIQYFVRTVYFWGRAFDVTCQSDQNTSLLLFQTKPLMVDF